MKLGKRKNTSLIVVSQNSPKAAAAIPETKLGDYAKIHFGSKAKNKQEELLTNEKEEKEKEKEREKQKTETRRGMRQR